MILLNSNEKLKKALKFGIKQLGLELLPHYLGGGKTLCQYSTPSCRSSCLVNTGHARFSKVMSKRKERTDLFLEDEVKFVKMLINELNYYSNIYANLQVRLNVFSDIPFENILVDGKNIFEHLQHVVFYDYTKNPFRVKMGIPNYTTVFSGQSNNERVWLKFLKAGNTVALVFQDKLPETYKGFTVINGDTSDNLVQWKGQSVIVGLKYKNSTLTGSNNKELKKNNKLLIAVKEVEIGANNSELIKSTKLVIV